MGDLLNAVKKDIGHFKCPTHGEMPKISVSGDKLNMTTCCDEFSKTLQIKMNKSVENFTKKSMDNIFKKMGKR